jgi:two-component sensor histidine kinase
VVEQVLLLAADVTELKALERERLASEHALMLTLVREVHHRIKNHLQGLIGLLRMHQGEGLTADEVIERAILQVHSIATVHGLLARHSSEGVDLNVIVRETVRLIEHDRTQGPRFEVHMEDAVTADLQPDDTVALALVIGELIMNAAKHTTRSPDAHLRIGLHAVDADTTQLSVRNGPAVLPPGFSLESTQGSRGGLDLIQRLLPTGSQLTLDRDGDDVLALLSLRRVRSAPRADAPS